MVGSTLRLCRREEHCVREVVKRLAKSDFPFSLDGLIEAKLESRQHQQQTILLLTGDYDALLAAKLAEAGTCQSSSVLGEFVQVVLILFVKVHSSKDMRKFALRLKAVALK